VGEICGSRLYGKQGAKAMSFFKGPSTNSGSSTLIPLRFQNNTQMLRSILRSSKAPTVKIKKGRAIMTE